MRKHKKYLAILLLATFAVGGIAGPLVHRIHHSLELEAASEAHGHSHPTDGSANFATGVVSFGPTSECVLCAPIVSDVPVANRTADPYPYDNDGLGNSDQEPLSEHRLALRARAPPAVV